MVPKTTGDPPAPHPAWRCGIFVVHGIGSQSLAQVAATLRSGFDDAWAAIDRADPSRKQPLLTPPYVLDGWWANYQDVEKADRYFEPPFCAGGRGA